MSQEYRGQPRRRQYTADVVEEYDPTEDDSFWSTRTQSTAITTQRRGYPLPTTGQKPALRQARVPARSTREQLYTERMTRAVQPSNSRAGRDVRNLPAQVTTQSVPAQQKKEQKSSPRFNLFLIKLGLALVILTFVLNLFFMAFNGLFGHLDYQPKTVLVDGDTQVIVYMDSTRHLDTFIVVHGDVKQAHLLVGPRIPNRSYPDGFEIVLHSDGNTVKEELDGPFNILFQRNPYTFTLVKDKKGNYSIQDQNN